jgi:hypothetical protein
VAGIPILREQFDTSFIFRFAFEKGPGVMLRPKGGAMLQKFTFYDDPFSEMEAFDSVETFDADDDFLPDEAGEGTSSSGAPKGSAKRASAKNASKKRSGHTRARRS